jgi:hypothetical protein
VNRHASPYRLKNYVYKMKISVNCNLPWSSFDQYVGQGSLKGYYNTGSARLASSSSSPYNYHSQNSKERNDVIILSKTHTLNQDKQNKIRQYLIMFAKVSFDGNFYAPKTAKAKANIKILN